MNTLLKFFRRDDYLKSLHALDRMHISELCVRYMFKLLTLRDFNTHLREYGLRSIDWRNEVKSSSVPIKIKLWLRWISCGKEAVAATFGVQSQDKCLRRLVDKDPELRQEIADIEGVTLTLRQMNRLIAQSVADVLPHVKIRTWRKLRFLTSDGSVGLEDFHSELIGEVVSSLYSQYPRYQSELHVHLVAKTVVNNISINIITRETSDSRRTKYMEADGSCSSLKVSMDALTENAASGMLDGLEGSRTEVDDIMFFKSLGQMLNTPKRIKSCNLLMRADKDFTRWLISFGAITPSKTNMDLQDKLQSLGQNDQYIAYVESYVGIPTGKLKPFLEDVAKYTT